ncbi:unnamed protein product [Lasius platythorax]|uniref:Uncharacterized protein n=1 Tax=Lasius platythorax TaxID=488582 RepID=A0AAV2MZF1_9HYME
MDKTIEEEITLGGSPGTNPENPPSSEAGLTDSGGGQPLPIKDNLLKCTLIKRTQQRQRCHSVGDKPKTSPAMPDMSEPSTSKGIDPAILTNRMEAITKQNGRSKTRNEPALVPKTQTGNKQN